MKIIKNIILVIMVIICVFLSSQVWLQLPDFLSFNKEAEITDETAINFNIWEIVKPNKYIINTSSSYTSFTNTNDYAVWDNVLDNLDVVLRNFQDIQPTFIMGEYYPKEYIMLEFENKLPIEIFTENFGISKDFIKTKLNFIKKIVIGVNDFDRFYIYNGEGTILVKNNKIDNTKIYNSIKHIISGNCTTYSTNVYIGNEAIPIPVPKIEYALNPVYVKSEIDIKDKTYIENIARNYFKNNYDYVRKSEEIEGNVLFVYKNEKVLKISSEGLLDFFDSNTNKDNNNKVYDSLITALKFSKNFLEFPKDVYLSSVDVLETDGKFGYRFTFTYRILNNPILFSKVRESSSLEIDVIGGNVTSYKRLVRDIDDTQKNEMKEEKILSVQDVISRNISDNNMMSEQNEELKIIDKSMLSNINGIKLAYFDRARKTKEQLLIVVWVINIGEKTYIFNAITGAIIEIW